MAIRHKLGAGLAKLGGVRDSYNEIFRRRQVYGETIDYAYGPQEIVDSGWCSNCRLQEGLLISSGAHGIAVFGPYVQLDRGSYEAQLSFAGIEANKKGLSAQVTVRGGTKTIAKTPLRGKDGVLPFRLSKPAIDVELRILSEADNSFALKKIRIRERSDVGASLEG